MKLKFLTCSLIALFLASCGNNIDSQLDSLESTVDKIIEVSEKAKDGDAFAAIEEGEELVKELDVIGSKLQEVEGEMTPEQKNRLEEIEMKMVKAMM